MIKKKTKIIVQKNQKQRIKSKIKQKGKKAKMIQMRIITKKILIRKKEFQHLHLIHIKQDLSKVKEKKIYIPFLKVKEMMNQATPKKFIIKKRIK